MAAPPQRGAKAEPTEEPKPGSEIGMDKRALKKLLVRSRKGPVNCALAQSDSESGNLGLVLMHKMKRPKGLLKELREQFPTAKNPCFGTASVDEAADAFHVSFKMNKVYPGLDKKLTRSLRGTGFKTVTIDSGEGGDDAE